MSKIADTEANATSLDGLVNDSGLIPTLRNGPKPSWQYLVDTLFQQVGYGVAGFFADGFTYTSIRQVGIDPSGDTWIFSGGLQDLPHQVIAGTSPSEPIYKKVYINDASQITLDNGESIQSYVDNLSAEDVINESQGTVQDALTYATPEMYGLDNLDELQDQEESNLADKKFQVYAGIKLRNSRTSAEGLIDAPNFAGQTDYGNEPIGFIFHHYTDGNVMQIDNVGESNTIVTLKNAFNPNRRPDKDSDFVGNGNYVAFDYHDYDAGFSKRALYLDKDAKAVWTGAKGTATLWQNKAEDNIAAFRIQTTNSHLNILDILNGVDKSRSFTIRNDVGFTRYMFRSESTQTSGIGFEAQAGDVWLISNDSSTSARIKINKPMQSTAGNTQLTAPTDSMVESLTPLRSRGYNFASLPDASLYAGAQIHIIDRGYKQAYSNGTDWLYVSDDLVVS